MSQWWVEIRRWQKRHGKPVFVRPEDLGSYVGFRSVYAYSEEDKQHILERGGTADLRPLGVYSETLFLDFDNTDPTPTLEHLYDEGHSYDVWHSGNRSIHVHVPLEPMSGVHVPYSQRCWVQANCPGADLTFYHQAGQYRLPGTRHDKTGDRKVRLREYPHGRPLEIPVRERPTPKAGTPTQSSGSHVACLFNSRGEGGRRAYVWHLANLAHQEGLSEEVATRNILWWNANRAVPPLPVQSVLAKISEVY